MKDVSDGTSEPKGTDGKLIFGSSGHVLGLADGILFGTRKRHSTKGASADNEPKVSTPLEEER